MLWRFNQHVSVLASALGTAHACFLSLPANAPGGGFHRPLLHIRHLAALQPSGFSAD